MLRAGLWSREEGVVLFRAAPGSFFDYSPFTGSKTKSSGDIRGSMQAVNCPNVHSEVMQFVNSAILTWS